MSNSQGMQTTEPTTTAAAPPSAPAVEAGEAPKGVPQRSKLAEAGLHWAEAGLGFGRVALEQAARAFERAARHLEMLQERLKKAGSAPAQAA
jgi:hypothetical protein